MSKPRRPDLANTLSWVFVQGFIFTPAVIRAFWSNEPVWLPGLLINLALAAWVGYALVRNMLRLWMLGGLGVSRKGILAHCVVAAIFAVGSAVMIFAATNDVVALDEGKNLPTATALGTLSVALIAFATRAALRSTSIEERAAV